MKINNFKRGDGWNDYLISGLSLPRTAGSAPTVAEFRNGIYLLSFADGVMRETWAGIHVLHDYIPNTKMYMHVHWTHNVAVPSGDVQWHIDYTWAKGYGVEAFGAPQTLTLTQTAGAQYTHHIIEDTTGFSSVNGSSIETDGQLLLRIYRDPTGVGDTFADTAFLIGVDLHYESDGRLTDEKNRPFTRR